MIDAPLRRPPVQTPGVAAEADAAQDEEVPEPEVAAPEAPPPDVAEPDMAATAEPELERVAVAPPPTDQPPRPAVDRIPPTPQGAPAHAPAPAPASAPASAQVEPVRDSAYIAGLAGTVAVVPMVAMVAAVVVYLVGAGGSSWTYIPIVSLASAALIWALLGLVAGRFPSASGANVDEYGQLAIRLDKLKAWLDTIPAGGTSPYPDALTE